MYECKRKSEKRLMKDAYKRYKWSSDYTLRDCYDRPSYAKENAFNYCRELVNDYQGRQGRIISYNLFQFTYGFIGKINGKDAFFYITKEYDRYIYLEDLED